MAMFYLSFADDEGFLGGITVTDVSNIQEALRKTWALKQNPGGQVAFVQVDELRVPFVPPKFCNRLMNKDELMESDRIMQQVFKEHGLTEIPDYSVTVQYFDSNKSYLLH